jgi:Fic family protein
MAGIEGKVNMAVANSGRVGAYEEGSWGYRAFLPTPLPPSPPVRMDDELWELLSKADRALGRLDGATSNLPNPDLFVVMYVRKEAVLSSQIEGTQASLMDVLEFEAQALDPGRPQDVREVSNYVDAMNYGLEELKASRPVSLGLIREIHGRLLKGVRGSDRSPGEFRKIQNWVGPPGCGLAGATHVPPPPAQMEAALNDLDAFIRDRSPMPALLKVGLAHSQFETIHPFGDGNGRTGRLLITFLLCEREILLRPLLYLSYYFKNNRGHYYDSLQAVRDVGDWEGWLKFFLRGVFEVSQEATTTAWKIVNLREEHRQLLMTNLGRGAQKALMLLERLYDRPIVSVQWVADTTHLTFTHANRLVQELTTLNILVETTGRRRNRRFAYMPYINLFTDPEEQQNNHRNNS